MVVRRLFDDRSRVVHRSTFELQRGNERPEHEAQMSDAIGEERVVLVGQFEPAGEVDFAAREHARDSL